MERKEVYNLSNENKEFLMITFLMFYIYFFNARELKDNLGSDDPEGAYTSLVAGAVLARVLTLFREKSMQNRYVQSGEVFNNWISQYIYFACVLYQNLLTVNSAVSFDKLACHLWMLCDTLNQTKNKKETK